MKEINVKVYEADDYKVLDDMSVDEIINELNGIDDGWLSISRYYDQDEYKGDENDYYAYKMHKALRLAIEILMKKAEVHTEIGYNNK